MYKDIEIYPSPLLPKDDDEIVAEGEVKNHNFQLPLKSFVEPETFVIQEKYFRNIVELQSCYKFLRAGAMKEVVYKAENVKAAIVTCGGLCPGLNVVIKSLVDCLEYEYGVKEIWGIRWGYRGFYEDPKYWI